MVVPETDDACSAVRTDLQAGTFTRYTDAFPMYIRALDPFQGGSVYIILQGAWRDPVQTVNGPVLYTKRGCVILISATNPALRDQVYLDIVDILTATNRGYKIKRSKDKQQHQLLTDMPVEVEMLL